MDYNVSDYIAQATEYICPSTDTELWSTTSRFISKAVSEETAYRPADIMYLAGDFLSAVGIIFHDIYVIILCYEYS